MGAEFQSMTIDGKATRDEVTKRFNVVREEDLYENGHSYSGGFGMASGLSFEPKAFDREDDAYEWLTENCEKWENAIAVTYKDANGAIQWMIGAWCAS